MLSASWTRWRRVVIAVLPGVFLLTGAAAAPGDDARWMALSAQFLKAPPAKALPLAQQTLALARRAFGPRDERTIVDLMLVAGLLIKQNKPQAAEGLLREASGTARSVLGPTDPVSLQSLGMLFDLLKQQGKNSEAEGPGQELLAARRAAFGADDPGTLDVMGQLGDVLHREGKLDAAGTQLEAALNGRRKVLGPAAANTLVSMNDLAEVYQDQGRLSDAGALLRVALQISRGNAPEAPFTLTIMNNLGELLKAEGEFTAAEPLVSDAMRLRLKVLGPQNRDTISSINNFAELREDQGRFGEAEQILRKVLAACRLLFGEGDPDTLSSESNLAALLNDQGRFAEAETLFRAALAAEKAALGPHDAATLALQSNLAEDLVELGRLDEAEPMLRDVVAARRTVLGPNHPVTLGTIGNLGALLRERGKMAEAEQMLREAQQGSINANGRHSQATATIEDNLAVVLNDEGKHADAEPILREALATARDPAVLGPAHPLTLRFQLNLVQTLAAMGRLADAARLQQAMEPQELTWLGTQLYSTQARAVRQSLVNSQSDYQNMALTLGLQPGAPREALELAASAVLRFKGLEVEEETYLAGIVRRGADARVRALAGEISDLHARLARAGPDAEGANGLAQALDRKELELGQISRAYSQTLRVRMANLQDLRGALAGLPARSGLLEIRVYRLIDFKTGRMGEPRWAGVLIGADGDMQIRDLGSTAGGAVIVRDLLAAPDDVANAALYGQVIGPFKTALDGLERLYVAPDGQLDLVNFGLLRGGDGKTLAEHMDVRLLQTGRDLLQPPADRPAQGLVAFGGIAYDSAADPVQVARAGGTNETARLRAAATFGSGFQVLPATKKEVEMVARLYGLGRREEPKPLVFEGARASKSRLMGLSPPRVLHLATHGFYIAHSNPSDRPLLLSGIALAGANAALRGAGDGILYAIETQDLNLEGTELVVLSACETAQGQIDYGDGASGLVRALRTAGARNVLVSLRDVSDEGAAEFMQRFYHHWLDQGANSDPAAAFRSTQLELLARGGADTTWTSFILVSGSS